MIPGMPRGPASFRLPVLAQDALLALFITVMQVQGTVSRDPAEAARPLTDFGNLGYVLLIVSGVVVAGRRRWPVPVFITTALASLVYYGLDFPDGPGWLGLFVALYTLTAYGDGRRSLVTAGVGITVLTRRKNTIATICAAGTAMSTAAQTGHRRRRMPSTSRRLNRYCRIMSRDPTRKTPTSLKIS